MFAAAELADERGRAIGVDLAEEMVARTAADIRARGITNAEVRIADGERLSEFVDGEFSESRRPLLTGAAVLRSRRVPVAARIVGCG